MSDSEETQFEENAQLQEKGDRSRMIFVKLLKSYAVVLERSQTPHMNAKKNQAWDALKEEYEKQTGTIMPKDKLKKLLSNMKTDLRNKVDKNKTGNKKIKLQDWEKQFSNLLHEKETPIMTQIPGGVRIGITGDVDRQLTDSGQQNAVTSVQPLSSGSVSTKRLNPIADKYETQESRKLSTSELQRIVLIKNLELTNLQIEKDKKQLELTNLQTEKEKLIIEKLNTIVESKNENSNAAGNESLVSNLSEFIQFQY